MLTRDGVTARYLQALCFYFASGTGMITGWPAALCGILGTIQLASALLRYSPSVDLWQQCTKIYRASRI